MRCILPASLVFVCASALVSAQTPKKQPVAPAGKPAASATEAGAQAKKSAYDKSAFENYLRHQFLIGPKFQVSVGEPKPSPMAGLKEVTVTVSDGTNPGQQVTFYVSQDGQQFIQGKVFEINQNPFRLELSLLKTEFTPSVGTPGATVVLVAFSDFQCAYCREEAKMLREKLVQTYPKQVRLYFKDFPLEQIHNWAKPAAIAGRCVFRQDAPAFWKYHDWVFDKQATLKAETFKASVLEWAASEKLDTMQIQRCIDARATEEAVNRSIAEGFALQVNSTPTLFVNGRRMVGHVSWEQLKQVIDAEIEYQKTAKNAGEDCGCELPAPIKPAEGLKTVQ